MRIKFHREGKGRTLLKNNCEYDGYWHNNLPHGRGVYKDPNGSQYSGEFVNGAQNGRASLVIDSQVKKNSKKIPLNFKKTINII